LEVYLPYGYDESQTYKTLYVSHGGGGNEAEWMNIGALSNILDNLIAEGKVEPMVVVTMDNTYWEWDFDNIYENFKESIIPYIEENYSVSTDAADRGLCGLSAGSIMTSTMAQQQPEMFQYYGMFSAANVNADLTDATALDGKGLYISSGNVDFGLMGDDYGTESDRTSICLTEKFDKNDIEYSFEVLPGAHDWGYWRYVITNFMKDHLWK
jgi:enterochelin esterase-like enzyme